MQSDTYQELPGSVAPPSAPSSSRPPGFDLRTTQLYLALTCVLVPLVSLAKRAIDPGVVNPPAVYLGVTAVAAVLLAASFSRLRWRSFQALASAFALVELAWFVGLLVANQFDPDIAGGYLIALVAIGAMFSAESRTVAATVCLTAAAAAGIVVAGTLVSQPESHPWVWLVYVVALGLFQVLMASAQDRLTRSLRESQRLYAEAEAAGGIGSWALDAETGASTWSDGLRALLEISPASGTAAPRIERYIHADDLESVQAAIGAVRTGTFDEHALSCRITTATGAQRVVRGVLRAERSPDGGVARVVGVMTDVTTQAAHQEALVEALDRAEAAARLKEAILANMSHEIRTPLTAVIGYAELLAEEAPADMVPLVEPIVGGGQRLLDTLNSVLDLARLEAEGASLETRPVELGAAAEAARAALAETVAAAGLAFGVEAVPDVWAAADAAALGRVLDNLVSNAIRFTDAGRVTLRVGTEGARAFLEVADTGRGMDPAFAEHAVEAFVQESAGDARSHEGSGLGLSIVSRLVDAMGGELIIVTAPGAGTTVRVALSKASPEALAAPAPTEAVWVVRRRLAPIAAKV